MNATTYDLIGDDMDKDIVNHNVTINSRKNIIITGVKKIDSFDENEFLVDTNMGYMTIKGQGLEIIKLDTIEGKVSIKGIINNLEYKDSDKSHNNSLFNKLFK